LKQKGLALELVKHLSHKALKQMELALELERQDHRPLLKGASRSNQSAFKHSDTCDKSSKRMVVASGLKAVS
jgi:hypothetical protein